MSFFSNSSPVFTTYQDEFQYDTRESYNNLFNLHSAIFDRLRSNDWDLHPHAKKSSLIANGSAATGAQEADVLTLSYYRSEQHAQMVEGLMGIDANNCADAGETYRHPVIELRLTPEAFAIELVLSPFAWWDQQNLVGKLEFDHHRAALHNVIRNMSSDYCFGFWNGLHLKDMHLTTWELSHRRVFDEWMNTFAEGQDWLRIGMWYEPDDSALSVSNLNNEVIQRIGDLYTLYDFMLWSSNNNFTSFYEKRQKSQRRYA
ncbi:MAG: hypothetical protein K8L99_26485 [Anaerolineae bacterium]|nr:hypothetical protein [Anaerolineae bacterium]